MMENREQLAFLTAYVDYYLWKNWDPIGGGDLGLPRNEYVSYTSAIVGKLLETRDERKIAAILHRFAYKTMGLNSTLEAEIPDARELLKILLDQVLPRSDLQFWEPEVENDLAGYFSSGEYPDGLVYIDLGSPSSSPPVSIDLFSVKWREILDKEFADITLKPLGYEGNRFVIGVCYDLSRRHTCPRGASRISINLERVETGKRVEWLP